ncbi:uncharacterized protein LOC142542575 [Primulina tabacum]|uniref:uncharacterized protein LOC142542575 n=1 Tax=Primulina tabacum TaxID=48773 RepID=UPI003F598410
MNVFRFSGEMMHLISILVVLLKIYATKSCSGCVQHCDEAGFVGSSLAILYCMRFHHVVRRSYDSELDTFRHYLLVFCFHTFRHYLLVFCFLLALLVHENFTFQERLSSILHPELGTPLLHRAAFQSMDFLRLWASPNSSICRLFLLLLHQLEKQRETEVSSLIQTRLHLALHTPIQLNMFFLPLKHHLHICSNVLWK